MKTLYLLRHAKSSWKDASLDDFERPLNKRGRRAAEMMGKYLKAGGLVPGLILCSAAERTRQTLKLVKKELGGRIETEITNSLYMASAEEMIHLLWKVDKAVSSVMIVSHNPGTEYLALSLTGSGDGVSWERINAKFPTAALAVLTFDKDNWSDLHTGGANLKSFVCPRDLD